MIGGIIQARMGSRRFPGKVLEPIGGVPMLKYQVERVRKSRFLEKIIIATTERDDDNAIADFCAVERITCFRGSTNDVLRRYFDCAKSYGIDVIVRLTGDCPLSDPGIIDSVVELFGSSNVDFAANTVPVESSAWPDGSDVEVFSFSALTKAIERVTRSDEKEHVTFHFWKNESRSLYSSVQLGNNVDWSSFRYTVDFPEDLDVVRRLVKELKKKKQFGHVDQIVRMLLAHPEISTINADHSPGDGWLQT